MEGAKETSDDELGTSARFGKLDIVRSLFDRGRNGGAALGLLVDFVSGERCVVGDRFFSGGLSTRLSARVTGT